MKVLIFGYGNKSTLAVSNILLKLSKLIVEKEDVEVVLFGYGESETSQRINAKLSIVSIKNPFFSNQITCYRIKRKLNHLFGKDDLCLSWTKLYRKANKIFEKEKFDYVIGASGPFCYMNAAFNFSKQKNIKFGMIYFDPFTNNISAKNKKERLRIEQKWYNHASFVFEEKNASKMPFKDSKKTSIIYDIPLFVRETSNKKGREIVYGGAFYDKFRSEQLLSEFLNQSNAVSEHFKIFSNKKDIFKNFKNVTSSDLVDNAVFEQECFNSKAIIVIGNGKESKTYPSKLIDAISFKKPIIGINLNDDFIKYPYYFSSNDEKLFEKINLIDINELNNVDLYKLFPNRNPSILVNNILGCLRR